jgi:hypothetical protein
LSCHSTNCFRGGNKLKSSTWTGFLRCSSETGFTVEILPQSPMSKWFGPFRCRQKKKKGRFVFERIILKLLQGIVVSLFSTIKLAV